MLVKIVGVQAQDYKLDNGYAFKGDKVHCIDLETTADGQNGNRVMDFKIPAGSPLASVPIQVGATYKLYFNHKKQADFLILDKPAEK